jgi:hypothetical protein
VEFPNSELKEARMLLLNPTAANLSSAAGKLESVASFLIAAKRLVESGQPRDQRYEAFLIELKGEMARIGSLLRGAAIFFNGLNCLNHASVYQQSGFLTTGTRSSRTLAQL